MRLFILTAFLTATMLGRGAFAAPAASAQQTPSTEPVLEIANDYTAPGMDRPFEAGYMPSVADSAARLVVPLRALTEEGAPADIRVSVDFGETSAPFVFENYDLTVPLDTLNRLYLIDLTVPLEENAREGRYPVAFHCSGSTADGCRFSQTFTVFVTVPPEPSVPEPEPTLPASDTDGNDLPADFQEPCADGGNIPDPGPDTGDGSVWEGSDPPSNDAGATVSAPEPTSPPQPKFIVTAAAVNPSPVTAGEPFSVCFTMKNMSPDVTASNMLASVEGDGTEVYVPDGCDATFIGTVKPGGTFTFSVGMMSAPEAVPGPKKIIVHAGYDGPQGTGYTQDNAVTATITQPVRFAVDEPDFPSALQAGDTWSLQINVMNLGRAQIRNVAAQVEAPGIRTISTLFLGNLESGSAKQGNVYAFVGAMSEEEGHARYGQTEGTLTVTCEDEYGTVHAEEVPFHLAIDAPVIRSERTVEEEPPEAEPVLSWQTSLMISGCIAGTAAGLWLYRRTLSRNHDEDE